MIVDGDVSPLRQKLRDAANDLRRFGSEGSASIEKIGGPLQSLQEKFIAVGAVLAGGAVFKAAVEQAASFTEESLKLGNALGTTATEASTFLAALADIDVSQEEFVGAAKTLAKEIKNNEDGLQAMGLKTRDAAGQLRPLNQLVVEAVDVLNGYKAGTDRAIAGQVLFGKGFDINSNLTKLNSETLKENAELQERLGLLVGQQNVQDFQAYDAAMDQANLTMKAGQVAVGNALLPALTKLAEWFVAIGPAAIVVIKGALGGLLAGFWALKNGVVVVWETINAMVVTVAEPLRALAAALYKFGTGDFKGAWSEFGKAGQTMVSAWKGALGEMAKSSQETRDKIWALFATGGPAAGPSTGGKSAGDLLKGDKTGKSKTAKDRQTEAEWEMEVMAWEARTATALANERADAEAAAYERATKAADEWTADLDRANRAVAESAKKSAEQRAQIELLRYEGARNAELARIDAMQTLAQMELDMGQINNAEYLARLEQFNLQRLAAEQVYLDRKREIAAADPEQNPVELERIEQERQEIRRRYAAQGLEIQRQAAIESQSIWANLGDTMSGLWDKGIQAMLNGTLTWRNALQAIGAEVVAWFAKSVVGDQVKAWLAGKAQMILAELGFSTQKKAIDAAATATTIASKTTETTAIAANNAVQAGTGAAASQASIPIVGPVLALAAMAAIFAAVSALGKRKSAAGGYDIPRGLNPVVQTHEEEMILPKKYANVIRDMAAGGAGQSGGGDPVAIYARGDSDKLSVGDLKKLLRQMGREFVDVRI
ncbi:MAG: hypothetical protein EKK55_15050 [Rhodocyclaceae bacterium]|nr:MAG: hypothetical protein EKK55_15050 [Rhodocyclaceae bacterium]